MLNSAEHEIFHAYKYRIPNNASCSAEFSMKIFFIISGQDLYWRLLYCFMLHFTKTSLFKYTENLTTKKWKFSNKKIWYFSYFCSKHRLWVLVRTASTNGINDYHSLCFWAESRQKYFSDKKFWYLSNFCSKQRLWVLVRTASMRRF